MTPLPAVCVEAAERAHEVLRRCVYPLGFLASAGAEGYPQVWGRDSMITALGALTVDSPAMREASASSLRSLAAQQTRLGLVPNNVDVQGRPNFQAYADGGLWFCIGAAYTAPHVPGLAEELWPHVRRALRWYEYQDVHDEGLITIEEGSDWEDLFAVRGRGLYVNCLHVLALEAGARIAEANARSSDAARLRRRAERTRAVVHEAFWYPGDSNVYRYLRRGFGTDQYDEEGFNEKGYRIPSEDVRVLRDHAYYIPYFTFRHFGEWFDALANLLAIFSAVADDARAERILDFAGEKELASIGPLTSLWPPILPDQKDWRPYYTYANLNLPHQYHNGGIWPFIGGFYVAALVRLGRHAEARRQLESLAEVNRRGEREWEFREWLHGETGEPRGVTHQAWSAGMYLFAHACVENGEVPLF